MQDLLTRLLLAGGGGFSPLSLFSGGVEGAFYDPFDPLTLFSDRAGTTPCGTPGGGSVVPVGLMLDKSQGLVLGPELVDTANTTAGWTAYGTNVVSQITNGVAIQYSNDARGAITVFDQSGNLSVNLAAGVTYEFRFTVSINTGTAIINLTNLGTPPATITVTTTPQNVVFRSARTAFAPEMAFNSMNAGETISITNISVRELPGNHAIAANDTTARPELSARVNLLTYSEAFEITNSVPVSGGSGNFTNGETVTATGGGTGVYVAAQSTTTIFAISGGSGTFSGTLTGGTSGATRTIGAGVSGAWGAADVTVTANNAVAPDGTTTADKLIESATTAVHVLIGGVTAGSTTLKLLCYAKQAERQYFGLTLYATGGSGGDSTLRYAIFDLSNGTVTGQSGVNVGSPTITPVGNNWYRCSIEYTYPGTYLIQPRLYVTTSPTALNSYAGNGTSGIYIWGADLRPANIGTSVPSYQRIADQYTYDNVGFPRYLAFNGTSSAMSTPANVNLSGTDKVTVFAGVRKNTTTTGGGAIVEFSSVWFSNPGTFVMYAPDGNAQNFGWGSRGTAGTSYVVPLAATQTSYVATGVGNISGDVTQLRLNGAVAATDTADQGAGNYGSYPLFIGSRNNASLFFNGNIYSLIVVGSAVSAGNIVSTEQWVAQRTGITI